MKCIVNIYLVLLITGTFLGTCYAAIGQVEATPLRDKDGNTYSVKTMADGRIWMTENLVTNIPDSHCYDNALQNCKEYGRLYSWESAQEGCRLLGDGWRLPTTEEWVQMAGGYGGVFGESRDSGRSAYKALLKDGPAGFNALLGGGREPDANRYARLEAHGFYWTATEFDTTSARFLNFAKGAGKLFIQESGEKRRAFSVRCVKGNRDSKEKP